MLKYCGQNITVKKYKFRDGDMGGDPIPMCPCLNLTLVWVIMELDNKIYDNLVDKMTYNNEVHIWHMYFWCCVFPDLSMSPAFSIQSFIILHHYRWGTIIDILY